MNEYGKRVTNTISNHRVREHINVWEIYMGVAVPDGCCIHHLDEDKSNNDILNLVCMTRAEHSRWHGNNRRIQTSCWKHTDEAKEKIRKSSLGKKHSEDVKQRISKTKKGVKQKLITCPHCGKTGGTTMKRWHFNNCKEM